MYGVCVGVDVVGVDVGVYPVFARVLVCIMCLLECWCVLCLCSSVGVYHVFARVHGLSLGLYGVFVEIYCVIESSSVSFALSVWA